ncbi:MAG TPA: glycosyltransferase family 39 protein [Gemmataceae bacterium]|jgi:4-amino-4-deoxy-L-arabinose transferase-like glycosyltransferase|nr:glycosyltransferase family 39 protein [Gemmataceae bacterium]
MFRFQGRPAHYVILAVAYLALTLPNLGGHSLWDMDEGVNAEAGREMLESGRWITPHFNYEIRTAKPALLYWLQAMSFMALGVNEFAARLPAVICGLGSVWVTYELGRRMFSATAGLLAGLILASCVEFCLISHAATPDPPLVLFLMLVFYFYWAGSEGERRWWFIPCAAFCGLAVLTKGPVGVGIPGLVILLHLAWTRQLAKLWDRRLLLAGLVFIMVAAPWYGLVTLDTRGKWLQAFMGKENLDRFANPADGHVGPIYYHVAMLYVLLAPWCVFLAPVIWTASREARRTPAATNIEAEESAGNKYRFLIVWFLSILIFFSIAATKLPNYILPLYPAVAILIGRWLDRWRTGELAVPSWVIALAVIGGVLTGIIVIAGLLLMGGKIPISIQNLHPLPNIAPLAWVGLIPIIAALGFGWSARQGRRDVALTTFVLGAVAFIAPLAGWGTAAMDDYKAPKYFAEEKGLRQTDKDIRIGACGWFRQSLVFYSRREVTKLLNIESVNQFLAMPRAAYVVMPEEIWQYVSPHLTLPTAVIAEHYDFYERQNVIVVANRYATEPRMKYGSNTDSEK